jgi:hypothetical protein
MAKDAGNEALKALSSRWEAEDKAKAEHDESMKAIGWTLTIICIIGIVIYFVWLGSMFNF